MENNEKKTALRFEVAGNMQTASDASKTKEPRTTVSLDKPKEVKEEFAVPDRFNTSDRMSNDSLAEDAPRIRTTYVPKFTEASDNFRRSYNSVPRTVRAESKPKSYEAPQPRIDPTAEFEDTRPVNRVVVTSSPTTNREFTDESVRMYKFNTDAEAVAYARAVPQANDARYAKQAEPQRQEPPRQENFAPAAHTPEVKAEPAREQVKEQPKAEPARTPIYTYSPASDAKARVHAEMAANEGPVVSEAETKGNKRKMSSEFAAQAQRDAIKDKFLDALMAVRVRLIVSIIIGLAVFAFEGLSFFGNSFIDQIRELAYGEAIIEILFATALLALAMPEIVRAVRYLFHYVACPELMLPVSYAVLLGYTLTVVFSNTAGEGYLKFGLVFAIQVIISMFASYFRLSSEFASFKVASKNVVKCVLDRRFTRTLPRENMALDGAIDEYKSKIARVYRTAFVSDFFRRASKVRENSINVISMLGISLGISLVTGVVGFFLTESASAFMVGFESFALVFMLAIPAFSILVHKLPLKKVVEAAGKENSTFVGESSVYEGADVDVIAYEDTEIFGADDVSIRKVHLYGKAYNTAKAMREMYALFAAVGGPLEKVFEASLDRKCSAAEGVIIENDGLIGNFEGHKILAGTEEFMLRHNITIPADDYKTKQFSTDSTRVMYGAEDGEVYVKFFLRYSFSETFTMLIPEFKSRKIVPLVYTRDPNLTGELLRVLTLGEDVIRVMKVYQLPTENKLYRRISSGIITLGEEPNSVNMLLLARRYTNLQSNLSIVELVSMIMGGVLGAALAVVFMNEFALIPSFALVGWHLIWCICLSIASRSAFKLKNKEK